MSSEDVGRDLSAVEQLQRKQDELERDMTAIEGKLKVTKMSFYTYVLFQSMNLYIRNNLLILIISWIHKFTVYDMKSNLCYISKHLQPRIFFIIHSFVRRLIVFVRGFNILKIFIARI